MAGQDDEGQEKAAGASAKKDSDRRTCAQKCINYEHREIKHIIYTASVKSVVPEEILVTTPPFSDDEDPRIPRAVFWSGERVQQWMASIGFPQYESCLAVNHVTGRQLIQLTANSLPRMGIQNFDHVKTILRNIEKLLGIKAPSPNQSISLLPREIKALYLEQIGQRGNKYDNMVYAKFLQETEDAKWQPDHLTNFAFMLPPELRIQVPALRK